MPVLNSVVIFKTSKQETSADKIYLGNLTDVPDGEIHHHAQTGPRHHQPEGRVLHPMPAQAIQAFGQRHHLTLTFAPTLT